MNVLKMVKSFQYAFKGILELIKSENNAKFHFLATFLVIIAGFIAKLTKWEWIVIIVIIALVWSAEAFNSAIEKLCDVFMPEKNVEIGKVKDLAAAGVFFIVLAALITAIVIFLPKILI